jgi:hypothetical protein
MTAHEALSHAFVVEETQEKEADLLPTVKKNFNARRTLHTAIDTIRAINKLREGGAMMNGALSGHPAHHRAADAAAAAPPPLDFPRPVEEDTPMPDRDQRTIPPASNKGLWNPPAAQR